jgi:hypothetical protein
MGEQTVALVRDVGKGAPAEFSSQGGTDGSKPSSFSGESVSAVNFRAVGQKRRGLPGSARARRREKAPAERKLRMFEVSAEETFAC